MGSPWIKSIILVSCMFSALVECSVHNYKFDVVVANVTRNCWTKPIVTVNGQFPGPTLYVREDDTVLVQVVNHVKYNISIHWHGVKQLRNGWADGPSYITQCPIQPGQSYVYNFTLTGQRGTLWWHAHILWLRATVHGALVILPKLGVPYPYPTPYKEEVLILGEWWNSDVEAVADEALSSGAPPNISDTHTINSYPGPLSRCSSAGDFILNVETGKTYMLRIISAALNDQLFFKIAGHQLTVVEVDATYVKPFNIETILVSPGQTINVLVTANKPPGKFLIIASPFMDSVVPVDDVATSGLINYSGSLATSQISLTAPPPQNKTELFTKFATSLKSLNSQTYPCLVPLTVDHSLLFTVGVGLDACANCDNGVRFVADINNITFEMPTTALLQAHYFNKTHGVFSDDFPGNPLIVFNYTGTPPNNTETMKGTRLYRLAYNSTMQIVLQGTQYVAPETHPMHLHGFNFFEVGRGFGDYESKQDPLKFNLVDPVERNTIGVPTGGWTAIRFRADNPGVWFFHCHLEVHTTWGLKMAFVVDNGNGPNESVLPPPSDLPTC